jgi:hypothetical protein
MAAIAIKVAKIGNFSNMKLEPVVRIWLRNCHLVLLSGHTETHLASVDFWERTHQGSLLLRRMRAGRENNLEGAGVLIKSRPVRT